jgi:N-acetylglucosamine-6-phosphate deacetylase
MILRGNDVASGKLLECEVVAGKIARVQTAKGRAPTGCLGGANHYLAPGMIDIQVNGFAGTDLLSDGLTRDDVLKVMQAQWRYGVTQFLPTVTTAAADRIRYRLRTIADTVASSPRARAAIPCIHLEGPYFCADEGPRGAHPLEHIRKPSWNEFESFQEAARGLIKMVTLAPEVEGAIPFIERLASKGIIPAIGHTNSKESDIDAAIRAGAKISTHLGNGSHNMLPRHANYLQMQIARDELWASLITDGPHLPPYFVKNLVRAKQPGRCILTTDAISAAGAGPGRYRVGYMEVVVGADRVVRHPVLNCLAGSAATLDDCVTNVVRWAGISLAEGLAMATTQPAKLLGLKSHGLAAGKAANLILFRWGKKMEVTHTILAGEVVFER